MHPIELFERSLPPFGEVIEVGGGNSTTAEYLKNNGKSVIDIDYADNGIRFEDVEIVGKVDGLYCSHTLEHVRNPGIFLDKIRDCVAPGGVICLIVPPAKHNIVGGHLSIWNAGLLLYNLIRAHIDCSDARISTFGYNIAVAVRNIYAEFYENELREDNGDIETLARFFPFDVVQGFDGRVVAHNWRPFDNE